MFYKHHPKISIDPKNSRRRGRPTYTWGRQLDKEASGMKLGTLHQVEVKGTFCPYSNEISLYLSIRNWCK